MCRTEANVLPSSAASLNMGNSCFIERKKVVFFGTFIVLELTASNLQPRTSYWQNLGKIVLDFCSAA